jgi:hypothetical protein
MWLSNAIDWYFEKGHITFIGMLIGALLMTFVKWPAEPPPVAPAQGYVIRRGEFTIIDKRTNPDATINPSYMPPNMRYICVEDRK